MFLIIDIGVQVVNHVPQTGLGSRIIKHVDLPLIRYDLPMFSYPSLPSSIFQIQTSKAGAPVIQYRATIPTSPIGPLDLVSIALYLYTTDPSVSIRSASLIIERRIQLNQTTSHSPYQASTTPPSAEFASSTSSLPYSMLASSCPDTASTITMNKDGFVPSSSFTTSTSLASLTTDSSCRPLLDHPWSSPPANAFSLPATLSDVASKTITSAVAGVESSGRFARDEGGIWSKTLTFQWPATKSSGHWAIGETISTELACVRFFARVKVGWLFLSYHLA
jgi:hypothetical protein